MVRRYVGKLPIGALKNMPQPKLYKGGGTPKRPAA